MLTEPVEEPLVPLTSFAMVEQGVQGSWTCLAPSTRWGSDPSCECLPTCYVHLHPFLGVVAWEFVCFVGDIFRFFFTGGDVAGRLRRVGILF